MNNNVSGSELPRGRHKLSPGHVAENQRWRIFQALAAVVASKGFNATSVQDVIKEAGVSRATFYQHFANKTDCLLKAHDRITLILIEAVKAPTGATDPLEIVEEILARYLGLVRSEPDLAHLSLIAIFSAGKEAEKRRIETDREWAEVLAQLASDVVQPNAHRLRQPIDIQAQAAVAVISHFLIHDLVDPPKMDLTDQHLSLARIVHSLLFES